MTRKTSRRTASRKPRKPAAAPATRFQALRAEAAGALGRIAQRGAELQQDARTFAAANGEALFARVKAVRAQATGNLGRLERVFEDRVGGVIAKLGVPTARDVRALSRQVAQLQQSVDQLRRTRARAR